MRPIRLPVLVAILGAVLVAPATAQAAPGDLDPSFGSGGRVVRSIGSVYDQAYHVLSLPDGGFLMSGGYETDICEPVYHTCEYHTFIARSLANGTLDPAFGEGDGILDVGQHGIGPIALQSDGRILVGGVEVDPENPTGGDLWLARLLATGSPDPSFGYGGSVTTGLDWIDTVSAVAVAANGSIVVGGDSGPHDPEWPAGQLAFARYLPDGSLDSTFAGDGTLVLPQSGTRNSYIEDLVATSDGGVAAIGYAYDLETGSVALVVRLDAAGGLDPGFGSGGLIREEFGGAGVYPSDVLLQPDGKLVASASAALGSDPSNPFDSVAVRYLPDGIRDASFGEGGMTILDAGDYDSIDHLAIQPDGKLILGGSFSTRVGDEFVDRLAAARLLADGTFDDTFGDGGLAVADFPGTRDFGRAMALVTDGGIVVAGESSDESTGQVSAMAAKFQGAPGGPPPPPPPPGDLSAPASRIERPHNGGAYGQNRLRQFTGTSADEASEIQSVQIALLRRSTDGSCAWWTGSVFASSDCNVPYFLPAEGTTSWSYQLPKRLTPSIGTDIQGYELFSRASDTSANQESDFEPGRNRNRFEIKQPRRA